MGGTKTSKIHQFCTNLWSIIRGIKTWQYFLILIPLLFLTATFLRFDHLTMLDLRTAVIEADEADDDTQITEKLQALKDYTESHTIINFVEKNGSQTLTFGSGPIYLEHQYYRHAAAKLQEAEQRAATSSDTNPNGNIYAQVKEICEPQAIANGWSWNTPEFIACWTENLAKFPTSDSLDTQLQADLPSTGLYRYDFASPVWTPTLSGFFALLCVIILLIIIIRIITWLFLRIALIFLNK